MTLSFRPLPLFAGSAACLMLAACDEPLDFDLRGGIGGRLDTADAARTATAERPAADQRGIISYPGYQVAVARRGDTVASLAARIGGNAQDIARFNGIQTGDRLRKGEIVALPSRVAEPAGGPIQPPEGVDITSLAGNAIDEADAQRVESSTLPPAQTGAEPVRHKVERGETAYTIARLYDVSVRSLAEWNGLGSDFAVREGQYLLIPVALPGEETEPYEEPSSAIVPAPGTGSPTPEPPSASTPLPEDNTQPAAKPVETTAAPDLGTSQTQTASSDARMAMPVRGDIIREYAKGKNDGIDIAARPGTSVRSAADGVVAAITEDTNGIPIIVVKHPDNLLTVYSNVANVAVKKGDRVGRGDKLAEIRRDGTAAVHFEVREGFDSVDPAPYLG
ncbi:LysM peptidoglycan-binding domain-containing protein [Roseovarius sp. A21]|uniref:LysM peptidoglycan-binding domain-containing protein n=1 Tax=Roseovarius bejariae TaxID=2576383 RepID=A0A844CT76_9RHOB|nr:peptidoglycan DD-metalloendopeptidase family protein [Roseovarius bejariae]MRU14426.1 LysM peptidoglycan-binding domain-containing protein [Roseovarius bejariae]